MCGLRLIFCRYELRWEGSSDSKWRTKLNITTDSVHSLKSHVGYR